MTRMRLTTSIAGLLGTAALVAGAGAANAKHVSRAPDVAPRPEAKAQLPFTRQVPPVPNDRSDVVSRYLGRH
jgi:hypothetical protein